MSQFEKNVKQAAESAVIKLISEGSWVKPDYKNRVTVSPGLIRQAWALVDTDAIVKGLKLRIEKELADRIMNQLAAEMVTDVKKLLSDSERREALRSVARAHLDSICRGEHKAEKETAE